jgi:hypothetical protein
MCAMDGAHASPFDLPTQALTIELCRQPERNQIPAFQPFVTG